MAIEAGQQLAHYRLVEKIGEGGMGVVWKALDTTLGREVAIKILPDAFSGDPDRRARFEREARLLATLNHPNIAAVYGLHEHEGAHFLAMELVAGENLATKLERDRLPIAEALDVGAQVAAALAVAHDSGVIHRDLKPGNIQITPDGQIKVLDFGLAKAFESDAAASGTGLSHSPTVTSLGTRAGVILGTAGYMSPEQARGKTVDKRTDNWAFGCVLFECLTGRQAFVGETVTDTLARILEREPDWSWLPDRTPNRVKRLLERCLAKDAARRLRDIGDVRLELEEVTSSLTSSSTTAAAAPQTTRPAGKAWMLIAAAFVVGAIVGGIGLRSVFWRPDSAITATPRRVSIQIPEGLQIDDGVFAGDGSELILSAEKKGDDGGKGSQLYRRSLDSYEIEPIKGTEGAGLWEVSPAGESIVFRVGEEIKKISIHGGAAVTIRQAGFNKFGPFGWIDERSILFVSDRSSAELSRISVDGGEPTMVSPGDPSGAAGNVRRVNVLPGGDAALLTVYTEGGEGYGGHIEYLALSTGKRSTIVEDGANGQFVSGHVVFSRRDSLLAAPFDRQTGRVTGGVKPMLSGMRMFAVWADAQFAVSRTGDLAYPAGGNIAADRRLVHVDRAGNVEPISEIRRPFDGTSGASPDGRRLAVFMSGENRSWQMWIYDFDRDSLRRIVVPDRDCWAPVWFPDGRRLVFTASKTGSPSILYQVDVEGGGKPEKLYEAESTDMELAPDTISPDGSVLVLGKLETGQVKLQTLSLAGDPELRPLFPPGAHRTLTASFSPDGKWIAYLSDETERMELYVAPYPLTGASWLISRNGGGSGIWSSDGKELYYVKDGKLYAVKLTFSPRFSASPPEVLFDVAPLELFEDEIYSGAPSERFVAIEKGPKERDPTSFNLVLNWAAELQSP